jgi:hypothetical protein
MLGHFGSTCKWHLFDLFENAQKEVVAHREGRTRSLQITRECNQHPPKSLTLYPIELGGHWLRL